MFKYILITFILIALNYRVNINKLTPYIYNTLNFSGQKNIDFKYNDFITEELKRVNDTFSKYKYQLNILKTIKLNYEVAEVLYFDNYMNNLIFVINKGYNNNIKINQGVITVIDTQPVVAGRVIATTHNTAKVLTIYSPEFYISSKTINENQNNNFILSGGYNNIYVKYFPYKYDFILGDTIYTTGNDGIFLSDYKIGKISKITEKDPEPEIIINPIINYKKLEWVIVLN